MATFKGSDGVVMIGANQLGEVKSYSVDETFDTIEKTAMGDSYRSFHAGLGSWNGSADVYFDDTNTAQLACDPGTSITVSFQMEGNTSGDHKLEGTGIVTSRSITASSDTTVDCTISFTGTGGLTEGTV
jgi:hypothetical protein